MNLLSRLTVAHRFALLVIVCGLAVLTPALMHALHIWGETQALQSERQGIGPARAALHVIRMTQQHRGQSGLWLAGQEKLGAARSATANEVLQAFTRLEAQFEAGGASGSALARHWGASRQAWATLHEEVAGKRLQGAASSARHTALVERMIEGLDLALAHWGLVFDPDPSDYFLIIGTLQEMPRLMEEMGPLRARGTMMLAAPDTATPARRAEIAAMADQLRGQEARMLFSLRQAAEHGAHGAAAVKQAVADLAAHTERGRALVHQHLVEPETLSAAPDAYFAAMTQSIDGMVASASVLAGALESSLQARAAAAYTQLAIMAAVLCAMFAAAIGVAVQTGTWLRRRLGAEPDVLQQVALRVAEGNLAGAVPVRAGDHASVMAAMAQMQQALGTLVGNVRDNAGQVASASAQIAQGNLDLSTRTESQAGAIQQTASSMEQLRTTIGHSADSARQASQLAAQAKEVAGRGGAGVADLAGTMSRIQESSKRIADIIGTIDSIAFQTNILALNAAVEAARAGEQGRGFAVVASEVRALAQRSSAAAREIRTLITDSVDRVEAGSRQGSEAAATMQEVVNSIGRVSDLIGEVSAAAQEQTAGVSLASEAVTEMDRSTQQNAALVEQTAAAAESLRQQAHTLQQAMSAFRTAGAAG